MKAFVKHFVLPLARRRRWRDICEIGASRGKATDELLRLSPDIKYTVIDPCLDADLPAKYAADKRVVVHKALSLDALPIVQGPFDCILIDGDHNWFTVYNELRIIHERQLLRRNGMVFFHDVAWPFGRRDCYYQPDTIPAESRQPFARKGIERGRSELLEVGGSFAEYCNADHEGGPRNGVLTAIEDFVREHKNEYLFRTVDLQFGLGIMQYRSHRFRDDLAFGGVAVKAAVYNLVGRLRPAVARARRIAQR